MFKIRRITKVIESCHHLNLLLICPYQVIVQPWLEWIQRLEVNIFQVLIV